jgi:hypothetical protein
MTAMMKNIFAQVLAEISPAASDSYHYSLAIFTHGSHEELRWRCFPAMMQVIHTDTVVIISVGMFTSWPGHRGR